MFGTMQNEGEYLSRAKDVMNVAEEWGKKSSGVGSEFLGRVAYRIMDVAEEGR